jgi:uncharacterized membrane protein YfcA
VAPRVGLLVGLAGGLAAVPGVLAALALPTTALRTVFGAFLIFTGARTLRAAARRARVETT